MKKIKTSLRKSICFVSETGRVDNPLQDPSVRYRCYHPAEALSDKGHSCTVVSATRFFEAPLLDQDIFIFHRPNMARAGFQEVMKGLRQQGVTLIADYDDLIFGDEKIALVSSAVKNGTLSEEKAIIAYQSNLEALQQFDRVTTSTEPLAGRVRQFNAGAQVNVVPNFIPESIRAIHRVQRTPFLMRPPTSIGYFAGTRSHDKDFPIIEAALHRVLLENPDFNLLVVGPVTVPRGVASLPNVFAAPVVNFLRLPALMSMCSTVIAPLEESDFNQCKSRVKFLEAALGGCNLIASSIPDMEMIGGEHLTLAKSTGDFYEALSIVLDTDKRNELAHRNFAFLEANSTIYGLEILAGLQ